MQSFGLTLTGQVQNKFEKLGIKFICNFCPFLLLNPDLSGPGMAFPIRIRIQESQINATSCGSESQTLLYFVFSYGAVLRIRDTGSGAFLTPGSGIRNRFFPDPKPIFELFFG
jgi:hypothetical protein